MSHPCLRCGACCAHFRVSLHWSEADPDLGGTVPIALTEPLRQHERAMRGTSQAQPRCVALEAEIGVYSRCSVHPQRPSACRAVTASWDPDAGGPAQPSVQCDRARTAHGLAPLTPADWVSIEATIEANARDGDGQTLPGHRETLAQLVADGGGAPIMFLQAPEASSGLAVGHGRGEGDALPEQTAPSEAPLSASPPGEDGAPA